VRAPPGDWLAEEATPMTEAIAIVAALVAAFVRVQYWLARHK
jgi:hypothetical protein